MEPEGSLPHSQVPATYAYPEPARSSPYPHILLPEDPTIYAWVSQVVSFPQASLPKPCVRHSSRPYALHAPPISFFSILSPEQSLLSSTDNSAPHYALIFFNPKSIQL